MELYGVQWCLMEPETLWNLLKFHEILRKPFFNNGIAGGNGCHCSNHDIAIIKIMEESNKKGKKTELTEEQKRRIAKDREAAHAIKEAKRHTHTKESKENEEHKTGSPKK